MSQNRILVVEDEELVRNYLSQLLGKAGWIVTAVSSGSEALAQLSEFPFAIVLCDLDLGIGMSGLDLLRQLPKLSMAAPFVFLTAYGTVDRCRDAMQSGAVDFIEKPSSPAKLLTTLNRALARIVLVNTGLRQSGSEEIPVLGRTGSRHVRKAIQTIERRYPEIELTVADVANAVGVSPEHLARLFSIHLKRSPLAYLHVVRIRAAEELLGNPDLSVYEIARECGYAGTSELDSWFKRLRRCTPGEARAQFKERTVTSDLT